MIRTVRNIHSSEKKPIHLIIEDLIWYNKFTLLLVGAVVLHYVINHDSTIFALFTEYGFFCLFYSGLMSTGYSQGFDARVAYIKPAYHKSVIMDARFRCLNTCVMFGIKGILLLLLGMVLSA